MYFNKLSPARRRIRSALLTQVGFSVPPSRQKIRHPVADQPMAYPGQALLPASPTYVLPAPIASKPDHMKEVIGQEALS